MELETAREQIIAAGRELVRTELVARTWGNVSARLSATEFAITPSGKAYENIRPEDIVPVNIKTLSCIGDIRPSVEKGVHAAVYRLHPEAQFVIHTHQAFGTAFSVIGENLTGLPEDKTPFLGSVVPCTATYGLNGTKALSAAITAAQEQFLGAHAVLMKSHGVICFGRSADDTFRSAFALEDLCRDRFAKTAGIDEAPAVFTPAEAESRGLISYHTGANGTNIFARTPILKRAAALGHSVDIFTDDAGQLFGLRIPCLPEKADQKQIFTALKRVPVAIIENKGAVCLGSTRYEAEAAFMIAEKNCLAAWLSQASGKGFPLSVLLQVYLHAKYMRSYAHLLNQ